MFFFQDWNDRAPITQKYNSKAAALYRDKISTLAQGKSWDMQEALQRLNSNNSFGSVKSSNDMGMSHSRSSGSMGASSQNYGNGGGGYQNSGSGSGGELNYQQFNTQEFKDQKEEFFNRRQTENASRPE